MSHEVAIFCCDPEEALASEGESKRLSIWNGAAIAASTIRNLYRICKVRFLNEHIDLLGRRVTKCITIRTMVKCEYAKNKNISHVCRRTVW
jgi:hypothetical protein